MTYYIVTRSLRNGALSFVCEYRNQDTAQRVADAGNHGKSVVGPQQCVYQVITSH
jgi:hypothetical protein